MSSGFKTRSDTRLAVQPQKLAASQVEAAPLISHLQDKRIKTTFYTDCKIYIEDGNFSRVLFLRYVYKVGGKSFL